MSEVWQDVQNLLLALLLGLNLVIGNRTPYVTPADDQCRHGNPVRHGA